MTDTRIICHSESGPSAVCVDDLGLGVLLTFVGDREDAEQVLLPADQCRRLGEWLIKRANEGGGETA